MLDICSTSIILTLLQNFKRAERMLNQHSYSQSEPRRHIAARLSADENGTLGPDLKYIQRLLTRDLHVCVCVGGGAVFTGTRLLFKKQWHLPFTDPPTAVKVIRRGS